MVTGGDHLGAVGSEKFPTQLLSSMVGFHSSYNQMEVPKGPWDLAGC